MEFAKTRQVLSHVRHLHVTAAASYQRAGARATSQRLQILLGYLESHENKFAHGLRRYERDASPSVLNTWFQFVPDVELPVGLRDLGLTEEPTVDDVLDVALDFDSVVSTFFGLIAESAQNRAVRDAFLSLRTLQESEHEQLMVQSVRMFDV